MSEIKFKFMGSRQESGINVFDKDEAKGVARALDSSDEFDAVRLVVDYQDIEEDFK